MMTKEIVSISNELRSISRKEDLNIPRIFHAHLDDKKGSHPPMTPLLLLGHCPPSLTLMALIRYRTVLGIREKEIPFFYGTVI